MRTIRNWRSMTTCAHQQLSHTRPASACLTSVGRQKASNPSVSVVPSRNLASHRKLQTSLQTYGPRVAATAHIAPHSASQQAPPQSKELHGRGLSAAEGRQLLVDSIPLESFKMAGVSFEGRQDAVSKLQPDQAVMMVRELDNTYDPDAIAVQTLSGQPLGYVPKEHTTRFSHDTTFGHVYSMGCASSVGLWGATVAVRPTLAPLTVDAIPENLAPHVSLSSSLTGKNWDAIREHTSNKANHRCEVSGGVAAQSTDAMSMNAPAMPLDCHEVWRADPSTQTLHLRGFMALHRELHIAQLLQRQHDDKDRQQAVWGLQAMNAWTAAEAEEYLKYVHGTAQARSSQEWKLNLHWLTSNNFSIPPNLQSLCRK